MNGILNKRSVVFATGCLALTLSIVSLNAQAVETQPAPVTPEAEVTPPAGTVDGVSDEARSVNEIAGIERLETVLVLNKSLQEGDKLFSDGEVAMARKRYDYVLTNSAPTGGTAEIHKQARQRIARLVASQAVDVQQKGDLQAARKLWQEAVDLEPTNSSYQAGLANIRRQTMTVQERFPGNTAATPELESKVLKIQRLILEGDEFRKTGQFASALSRYNEVLKIDKYNSTAAKRVEKVEKDKEQIENIKYKAQKEKAMLEVMEGWVNPPPLPRKVFQKPTEETQEISNQAKLLDKLENIIIDEINWAEVDVEDAIRRLQELSVRHDKDGEGVNLVLKAQPTANPTGEEAEEIPEVPPITLSLRDIPMIEVLNFIKDLTNLQYEVEEFAVFILPATETSKVLQIRSYRVPPTFFGGDLKPTTSINGGALVTDVSNVKVAVVDRLKEKGVTFPSGATADYIPNVAKMVVRNTLANLDLIGRLIEQESGIPTQIEIETKFLEFTEDDLKDFSFNWRFNGKTTGGILPPAYTNVPLADSAANLGVPSGTTPLNFNMTYTDESGDGVSVNPATIQDAAGTVQNIFPGHNSANVAGTSSLRNSMSFPADSIDSLLGLNINRAPNMMNVTGIVDGVGVSMLLTFLESTIGADLMSAPKVTVLNNQQAKVRVVRELRYPTEYDPPEIPDTGDTTAGTGVVIPANPSEFETRDVGVVLDVKATASKDRRIDLELKPEVTEFQGFINYGQSPTTINANNVATAVTEGTSLTPVFSVRNLETKLQVVDGQTVIMGGFIRDDVREIEDSVPFLGDLPLVGRLFRSKSEASIKRNLTIFLTARLINPDGSPKFLTEQEEQELASIDPEASGAIK